MDRAIWSLAKGMYEHCYWEEDDVSLVTAWLNDLHTVGYKFPKIGASQDQGCVKVD